MKTYIQFLSVIFIISSCTNPRVERQKYEEFLYKCRSMGGEVVGYKCFKDGNPTGLTNCFKGCPQ